MKHSAAPQTLHPAGEAETEHAGCFYYGGRVYARAQLNAALRCAEWVFTAYARASEELGLGARSIEWADLNLAYDHSIDALSEGQRDRIDAECVAQFHGVQVNGNGIVVQTVGDGDDIEVAGASIGDDHLQLLLTSCGRSVSYTHLTLPTTPYV